MNLKKFNPFQNDYHHRHHLFSRIPSEEFASHPLITPAIAQEKQHSFNFLTKKYIIRVEDLVLSQRKVYFLI